MQIFLFLVGFFRIRTAFHNIKQQCCFRIRPHVSLKLLSKKAVSKRWIDGFIRCTCICFQSPLDPALSIWWDKHTLLSVLKICLPSSVCLQQMPSVVLLLSNRDAFDYSNFQFVFVKLLLFITGSYVCIFLDAFTVRFTSHVFTLHYSSQVKAHKMFFFLFVGAVARGWTADAQSRYIMPNPPGQCCIIVYIYNSKWLSYYFTFAGIICIHL